jgi:hypothetical protein
VPSGKSLTLPAKFNPDNLDVVTGFGRPLLAVLNSQKELILPNTRKVILREFNLTGAADTTEMQTNRTKAKAFYEDLHIALDIQAQAKPSGQADLFMCECSAAKGMHLHELANLSSPTTAPIVELPLTKAPFMPSGSDKPKTVIVIWVGSAVSTAVEGKSFHPHRLITAFNLSSGMVPNNTPDVSFIFMPANASMANASATGGQGPEVLAHELGHILWADAGAGREWYNDTKHFNDADRKAYQDRINDLFIKDLGFDVKPADVGKTLLESQDHHHLADNLMNAFAANTGKVPNGLTFVQVGLFRIAKELVWP